MKIGFKFEESKAQIILTPANSYDSTNLENFKALNGKAIKVMSGANREVIIESSTVGTEAIAVNELPEPNPES